MTDKQALDAIIRTYTFEQLLADIEAAQYDHNIEQAIKHNLSLQSTGIRIYVISRKNGNTPDDSLKAALFSMQIFCGRNTNVLEEIVKCN